MGKTALARMAAYTLREEWRDGAWMVELAPVSDAAQLPQAVAQALRIALNGPGPAHDQLVAVLQTQSLLLVLDNCEHLVKAAGALASAIVAHAPGVRVLTTSQELLNVPDEKLFRLGPLAVPAAGEVSAEAGPFGAIELFVERARAADPRFALGPANAEAVAEICRRVDGLPLAIELAATRVRVLGAQGVRKRLAERFRVLVGGARTAMTRHQTLHAAIDWSHALLSVEEQTVLRRLGIFVGGFTLELAQRVAGDARLDQWAVLDALSALVDKSLVVTDPSELPRYRLLETTRAYALEKLADAGETAAWIERHARALCEFFEQIDEARFGERGTLSMDDYLHSLVPELDNVRAALDWAMNESDEPAVAIGLASASAGVFRNLGLTQEVLRTMLALQPRVDDAVNPQRAARFCIVLATLGNVGRLPKAAKLDALDRAERIYRSCGARRSLYQALLVLAWSLNQADETSAAAAMLPEILSLEDPAWPVWLRANRLNVQGAILESQTRHEEALSVFRDMQALLLQEVGEKQQLVTCRINLCQTLILLQRYEEAIELAKSVIMRERGEDSVYLTHNLMYAQFCLDRIDEAWQTMRQAMPGWRRDSFVFCGSATLALLLAARGRMIDGARVGGAARAYYRRNKYFELFASRMGERLLQLFEAAGCKLEDIERWHREGESLDEAAIAAICLGDADGISGSTTR
jgi:predicted ATPase